MSAHSGLPHIHRPVWDRLGMFASALCLIHCLAVPVLLPLLPVLALMPHTEVHGALLIPIIALSGIGILPGYLRHRAWQVVALAAAGVTLCGVAVGAEVLFHFHALDTPLTVSGGVLLILAHAGNLRLSRRMACVGSCPG